MPKPSGYACSRCKFPLTIIRQEKRLIGYCPLCRETYSLSIAKKIPLHIAKDYSLLQHMIEFLKSAPCSKEIVSLALLKKIWLWSDNTIKKEIIPTLKTFGIIEKRHGEYVISYVFHCSKDSKFFHEERIAMMLLISSLAVLSNYVRKDNVDEERHKILIEIIRKLMLRMNSLLDSINRKVSSFISRYLAPLFRSQVREEYFEMYRELDNLVHLMDNLMSQVKLLEKELGNMQFLDRAIKDVYILHKKLLEIHDRASKLFKNS